jgi:hypothetical protein
MAINRYGLDDLQTFANAIMNQLVMQTGGKQKIDGSGSYTEQNYPLIVLTIQGENATTVQYYIVGDKKHILIQLTDFHKNNITNGEEVAKIIVNSFKWLE